MILRATAAFFVLVLGSTLVFADPERKPLQIIEDIQTQVNRYSYFTIFDDINVAIDEHGVVALTGQVTGPHKSREIAARVAAVEGVGAVDNSIRVLPVSRFDDQLRISIARAIYGNSHFGRYGVGASPPIHIVVERGHVTLTGVVTNQLDRQLVEIIARRSLAYSVTNRLRTNEEARGELELLN
jgi:osmotically-inducible protein OsmY